MKLLDFKQFEAFNQLREKIGTEEFGYFELFDPAVHLTGSERSELENIGWLKTPSEIKVLPDKTLAIKNSRVLAFVAEENWYRDRREYPTFHVALCAEMEELKSEKPDQELRVTTKLNEEYDLLKIKTSGEVSMMAHGFVVCKHCLHSLRYKNYDEFRNRRRGYSQKVLNAFSLQEFYAFYQQYPLSFGSKKHEAP